MGAETFNGSFPHNREDAILFERIQKRIKSAISQDAKGIRANSFTWLKLGIYLCLIAVAWSGAYLADNVNMFTLAYVLAGFFSLLLSFIFSHDAAHNALFKSRKANRIFFEIVFNAQGSNAHFWRIRHIQGHHVYTNMPGYDADLDNNPLLRLHNSQKLRSWHRIQFLYAPLLYASYTLFWIFIKDIVYPLSLYKRKGIKRGQLLRHYSLMLLYKCVYVVAYLLLPYLFTPFSFSTILFAFLGMHLLLSLYLSITFLISHYGHSVQYIQEAGTAANRSWFAHQVDVCIDFHPCSKVANFIFGGFNAHLAHHLFPAYCHVHYPAISVIIREELKGYSIPYKSYPYWKAVQMHFLLLHKLGRNNIDDKAIATNKNPAYSVLMHS